jgi:hypothetical protein
MEIQEVEVSSVVELDLYLLHTPEGTQVQCVMESDSSELVNIFVVYENSIAI